MNMERVTFLMPEDMLRVAAQIARERDVTVGFLLRDLMKSEISRRKNARPPNRADEQLVAPLRARLAPDFAHATSWEDLKVRLHNKGFELRPSGGGLALHRLPVGDRICKASELGFSYSRLIERFAAPFPGHRHTWVAERALGSSLLADDDAVLDQAGMSSS